MEDLRNLNQVGAERKRPRYAKKHLSRQTRDYLFIVLMLAYPVLQFTLTWSFVNIQSVLNAFRSEDIYGNVTWGLANFAYFFDNLLHSTTHNSGATWINDTALVLLNSLLIGIVTVFVSLPLSLIFSYFLHKKMPLSNVFRAIFFLPNIIPVVALTFAYKTTFDGDVGYLYNLVRALGFPDGFFGIAPYSAVMIIGYLIWAGLGYNIILFSGAIARIPQELFEAAKLDHAGYFKEFVHVVIPCIWPTIVTLIVVGMTNVLTLYLQPLLLTSDQTAAAYTISMSIFLDAASGMPSDYGRASAFGLLMSLIWAPIILLVRRLLSKKYEGVDY
ncbi:MAG: carbohydrate ABC transporter permease [Bacilli bacterium]|jgi:ABC-type sugar transport system permease subunit